MKSELWETVRRQAMKANESFESPIAVIIISHQRRYRADSAISHRCAIRRLSVCFKSGV